MFCLNTRNKLHVILTVRSVTFCQCGCTEFPSRSLGTLEGRGGQSWFQERLEKHKEAELGPQVEENSVIGWRQEVTVCVCFSAQDAGRKSPRQLLFIPDTGLILESSSGSVPWCGVSTDTTKRSFLVFLGRTEVKDKEPIYWGQKCPPGNSLERL